jgi:CheY-like chemotaxis protein
MTPFEGRGAEDPPVRTILLVDDDELILEIGLASLHLVGGLDVLTTTSGSEALEVARAAHPDAILLDVMMPGLDGPATLARLKAAPATAAIPVVFLTAKARPAEQRRWANYDVVGVLTKPFDPMLLSGQVAEVLGWTP